MKWWRDILGSELSCFLVCFENVLTVIFRTNVRALARERDLCTTQANYPCTGIRPYNVRPYFGLLGVGTVRVRIRIRRTRIRTIQIRCRALLSRGLGSLPDELLPPILEFSVSGAGRAGGRQAARLSLSCGGSGSSESHFKSVGDLTD